jgi:hypothetical protein
LKRPSYIATKSKLECLELEFGRKWHIIDRIQNSGDAFEDVQKNGDKISFINKEFPQCSG